MLHDLLVSLSTEIPLIATTFGGIAAICGFIFAVYRFMRPGFEAAKRHFQLLDVIHKEFSPNGGSSMKDSINRIEHSIGVLRKDVAEEVFKTGSRQWALVATQKDPVWESDANGLAIRVNSQLSNLVQRGFEDFKGAGWENVIHILDRERVSAEWEEAVSKARAFESEYRVVTAITKDVFSVRAIATPYYDHEGQIIGWIGRYVSTEKAA